MPTRINKLREGQYDAIVLAKAGVSRLELDLSDLHVEILDPKEFIPAPAQELLGLQIREEDTELFELLQNLNDTEVQVCINLERKVLNLLEGGCQLPLGVYCTKENGSYKTWVAQSDTWQEVPKRLYVEDSRLKK